MKMADVVIWLPVRFGLAVWSWLWGWTYPLAQPAISEVRATSVTSDFKFRAVIDTLRFAFELPLMARAQHYAERSASTRTLIHQASEDDPAMQPPHAQRWLSEPAWR